MGVECGAIQIKQMDFLHFLISYQIIEHNLVLVLIIFMDLRTLYISVAPINILTENGSYNKLTQRFSISQHKKNHNTTRF